MQDLARVKSVLEFNHLYSYNHPLRLFEKALCLLNLSIPIPISKLQCVFNLEYLDKLKTCRIITEEKCCHKFTVRYSKTHYVKQI